MSVTTPALRSYPCAICNGTDRTLVMRKRGLAVPGPFRIVKCGSCAHHYVDPRISDEDLGTIYGDAYYHGQGFDRGINFFGEPDEALQLAIERIVTMVAGLARRPFGELEWLDYGCGSGNLLSVVAKRGAQAVGYDFGDPPRKICAAKGLKTLEEDELAGRSGTFDVVSAIEVIEHVPDPRLFLQQLASLLKVGGVLYVQTGNWNLIRHVPGRPYIMPEGHIQYFTPPTMRRLFAGSGLREADVLNVSWAGYKLAGRFPGAPALIRLFERFLRAAAPGYAQFPVGIRVA